MVSVSNRLRPRVPNLKGFNVLPSVPLPLQLHKRTPRWIENQHLQYIIEAVRVGGGTETYKIQQTKHKYYMLYEFCRLPVSRRPGIQKLVDIRKNPECMSCCIWLFSLGSQLMGRIREVFVVETGIGIGY